MPIIDADAHVIENESAWDYMLESERPFKPKIVGATNGDPSVDYWFIDGRLMPRSNVEKKLPQAARDMSDLSIEREFGKLIGVQDVLADEFNCLSIYSDAKPEQCSELKFLVAEGHQLVRQFKPPSLRNVAERGPYMHAGQFATLEEVLNHYNTAPEAPAGHSELEPLDLSEKQVEQIIAFLKTLSGPLDADEAWLTRPEYSN